MTIKEFRDIALHAEADWISSYDRAASWTSGGVTVSVCLDETVTPLLATYVCRDARAAARDPAHVTIGGETPPESVRG